MATRILSQDIQDKNVTSEKLEDNISINQSLTVGTDASVSQALGVGTTATVGQSASIGSNLTVGNNISVSGLIQNLTTLLSFLSSTVNSPTAIGFNFNTANLINQLGSLLLSLKNSGIEVFTIDGYGNVNADGYLNTQAGLISANTELRFKDSYTVNSIPLADTAHPSLPSGTQSIMDALSNAGTVSDLDTAYDGETGSGSGKSITADSGPVSIQRNFAGSDDPMIEIGDGYTENALELLADGSIVGGNSPFIIRSRESDTLGGSAFQLETTNSLSSTADIFRLINVAANVLRIKANSDFVFGSGLSPVFTATPPTTGGDDTAFVFNTLASSLNDSILKLRHGGVEKFAFDGYGVMNIQSGNLEIGARDGYVRFFSNLNTTIFKNTVGEYMTASSANLTLSSPLSNENQIILDGASGNNISFITGSIDSPSAEGFIFDSRNLIGSTGSKLINVKSQGTEVAHIDGYGNASFNEVESSSGVVTTPSTLQFQDANTGGFIPLSDPSNTDLPTGVNSILHGLAQTESLANLTLLDGYTVETDITVPGGQNFVVITNASALPNEVAASSFSNSQGAVAVLDSTMGIHSTDNNQLNNKALVRDADTNDPIFDGYSQEIFALLHAEASIEGSNFDVSSPNRLQLSFITINPISEIVTPADISSVENKTIEYIYNRRIRLVDASESALSNGFMVNAIPDSLQNSYDGYEGPGTGRHIHADSGPPHILVPDGYDQDVLELSHLGSGDGYGLKINTYSQDPAIYINQTQEGPGILFDKDNQNDIGRFQANRPRSLYIGTQVLVGNSIRIGSNSITANEQLNIRAPGSNTPTGTETPSVHIQTTGERNKQSVHEQPLLSIENFDKNVLRVDGYGSIYIGDTSDSYGLDASRIVFNADRFNDPALSDDALSAGLYVERGSSELPSKLFWNEKNDRWEENKGDFLNRHITSFEKTIESLGNPVVQDSIPFKETIKGSWQRALVHRIQVNTTSPDYRLMVYENAAGDSRKFFDQNHLVGDVDAQTSFYYKDLDGYNGLHYEITNHDVIAHLFDVIISAEVFYDGYDSPIQFLETFDGGGAFAGLTFNNLLDEDFDDTFFDAGGTELLDEDFDTDTFFDAGGTGLLTEDFDSYGVFDAYAGSILDSDDMNSLGF